MQTCPSDSDSGSKRDAPAPGGRLHGLLGVALVALLCLVAWPGLSRLVATWRVHSLTLPLGSLAGALVIAVWRTRRPPLSTAWWPRLPGGALSWLCGGLALGVLGARSGVWHVAWAGIPVAGLGALGLLRGEETIRRYWPAALLLLVAIPPPNAPTYFVIAELKTLVASGAAGLLTLCGLPTQLDGWVLRFAGGELRLVDACSGARTQTGLVGIAAVLLCLRTTSRSERVTLLAACVPAALVASVARVACVGVLYSSSWLERSQRAFVHDASGVLVIVPGVLLLLAAGWLVRLFESHACSEPEVAGPSPSLPQQRRAAASHLGVGLALSALCAVLVRAEPAPCPGHTPPSLPGKTATAEVGLAKGLEPDLLLARQGGDGATALWVHYCDLDMPHHAYAHATDVCYTVAGWTVLEEREVELSGRAAVRQLRLARGSRRRLVHLAFLDGAGLPSPSLLRAWLGRAGERLAGRPAAGSLLVISSPERSRITPAEAKRELERVRGILSSPPHAPPPR